MTLRAGAMKLALHPPLPPMEALSVDAIPEGGEWHPDKAPAQCTMDQLAQKSADLQRLLHLQTAAGK